jgi:hypothetical protein
MEYVHISMQGFDINIVFAGLEGIHVVARLKMVPQKMSSSYMVIHQIKFRMQN